jgi:hypothetical protein
MEGGGQRHVAELVKLPTEQGALDIVPLPKSVKDKD